MPNRLQEFEEMDDSERLEAALDGLWMAGRYAEEHVDEEVAQQISSLYQVVGQESPDDHWRPDDDSTE